MNNLLDLKLQKNAQGVLVMSSVDLAKLCVPSTKKDGTPNKYQHTDFLKKAKVVLGKGVGKFSNSYKHPQNGQNYTILLLPEREACLMAMSYSYELQAKVYDSWKALASKQEVPKQLSNKELALMVLAECEAKEKALEAKELAESKVKEKEEEIEQLEHKLTHRIDRVGYLLLSDCKRLHSPSLSREMCETVVKLKAVPTTLITVVTSGYPTQCKAVHEKSYIQAVEEFYKEIKQVTKTRYVHPMLGIKKFQA